MFCGTCMKNFAPSTRGHFLAQALHDLVGGVAALVEGLQPRKDAGGVFGRVVGVGAGEA